MKTLHLTNAFHATSGGIRHFYEALAARAPAAGCHLRLVVPGEREGIEDLNSHARLYQVRAPRSAFFDSRYRVILPHRLARRRGPIVEILQEEQPDLVEVCDKYSLCYLAGMLRKGWIPGVTRPVLVGLSCERMDDNVQTYLHLGRLGQALAALYIRRIYVPQFDHHLANSTYTASELTRQARKHPRPVQVLPMGVELDRFHPGRRTSTTRQALIERVNGSARTRVLVYAGRLAPEKNLSLLPRMLERLADDGDDYRLVVAGDGPLATSLAAECARRAPRAVHFWRHLDRDSLAALLANADVFVHPNPREPFGIAPLEAMASGLALVAPNGGGVSSYATEATAWPAAPTPEAFAERVRQIFDDPLERRERIGRALTHVRDFGWERVTGQFFAAYEQLVAASAGRPLMLSYS